MKQPLSPRQLAARAFLHRPVAVAGLVVIVLLAVFSGVSYLIGKSAEPAAPAPATATATRTPPRLARRSISPCDVWAVWIS